MKRLALILAAIATGVVTFAVVRLARQGDDAADSRPVSGQDGGEKSPGLHIPDRAGRPDSGQGTTGPDTAGQPGAGQPGTGGPDTAGQPPPRSFTFEDETRDPAWAQEHEAEMTLRLRTLVLALAKDNAIVDVDSIECRRSLCRVSLHARDVPALSKLYGAIEGPDGLYGWADNVLLDQVKTEPDGQVTTKITAVFDRE